MSKYLLGLFFIVFFLFRRTEEVGDKYSTIDITVIATVAYVLLVLLYVGYKLLVEGKQLKISSYDRSYLFYLLLAFISSVWSENAIYTLFFTVYCSSIYLLIIIALRSSNNPERLIFYLINILMLFEVVIYFINPTLEVESSTLDALHGSGSLQSILGIAFFFLLKDRKKTDYYLLFLDIIIVLVSTSFKIYLAGFVALSYTYLIKNRKAVAVYFKSILVIIVSISVLLIIIYFDFGKYDYGKIEHMGGRLLPWTLMIIKIKESFLLGYGFPFGDEIYIDKSFTIKNAHNVLIGSFLYIGVGGVLLLSNYFIQTWKNVKLISSKNVLYFIIIVCFINSLFNNSIAGKVTSSWFAVHLAFVYINQTKIRLNEK